MSMIPKTERNVIVNVPVSRPAASFESIMKDLQDLSKNVATRSEIAALEAKMKKLGKENQKIKADLLAKETELAATEKKRKLYYNLFHENVKVVAELKAENESLKAEIEAAKSSATEENRVEEISNSSIQSAIPVSETDSDIDDGSTQNLQPPLAICDGNVDDMEQDKPRSTRPANKRARYCYDDTTLVVKKSRKGSEPTIIDSWKCIVCKINGFTSIDDLRSHMKTSHPERYHHCEVCPFTCSHPSDIIKHNKTHIGHTTDVCPLCDVAFGSVRRLAQHLSLYH